MYSELSICIYFPHISKIKILLIFAFRFLTMLLLYFRSESLFKGPFQKEVLDEMT